MKLRKVKYTNTQYNRKTQTYEEVETIEAKFHQFGFNYEEFETGPGNFSTAIIELENGEVLEVDPSSIVFLDKPEGAV